MHLLIRERTESWTLTKRTIHRTKAKYPYPSVQFLDLQLKSFAHNRNERGEAELGSNLCQHP